MPEGGSTTAETALQGLYGHPQGGHPADGQPQQEQRDGAAVGVPVIIPSQLIFFISPY